MKQKINLRLALIALIAVIATAIGVTVVYYRIFQTRVRNDLQINAQLLANTGRFQELYQRAGSRAESLDVSSLSALSMDNIRITWISKDGTVLLETDPSLDALPNHLNRPEIQSAIEKGYGETVRRSETQNLNTFYYALRLEDHTILRVSTQARTITNVFLTAAPVIAAISLAIVLLCILFGHFLTLQLIRPINTMAEHLEDSAAEPEYRELQPFAEKIRSQHEKILESATMRQDFTARVSHELKTPLTAISGYAELIENHLVDEEQNTYIAGQIISNVNRLLSLINDTIKLSELDHWEVPRKFERIDLGEVAELTCRNMQVYAGHQNVTLSCRGSEAFLTGDRELLKELIENLVQNSIRYNHAGGSVQVCTAQENGHAILTVKDNGIGIPKDQQERVFERFYRVDPSRSRESGGTGLGLAIVKHIADIHNASTQLKSTPGQGTEVTVRF